MKHMIATDVVLVSAPVPDFEIEEHLRKNNRCFKKLDEDWTLAEFDEQHELADIINAASSLGDDQITFDEAMRVAAKAFKAIKRRIDRYVAREEAAA
jgi:hypothetical protein